MNEFIVWDGFKKKFVNDVTMYMSFNENGTINSFNGFGDNKYFNYIGLKDINNNKIYADSSIVKLEWKDYRYRNEIIREIGYFLFNKDLKCLEFKSVESKMKINFVMHIDYIQRVEIIDTIQENKLGLIK